MWLGVFLCGLACAEDQKSYISPNGKFIAKIISLSKTHESKINITDITGKILIKEDYTSEDGEHGAVIDKIKWTPDSKFLIYITYSSGGHQAWAYPSYFYSVENNYIKKFSDYFPAVAESKLDVIKPDIVKISIWTPLTENINLDESVVLPIQFNMSDLIKPKGIH